MEIDSAIVLVVLFIIGIVWASYIPLGQILDKMFAKKEDNKK